MLSYYHLRLIGLLAILLCAGFLSACQRDEIQETLKDPIDTELNLSRQDYVDGLFGEHNKDKDESDATPPLIPNVSDILAAPPPPEETGVNKLISLSVTQDVPLKDVLLELGRLADIEMEVDASITGGIILRVKNRPFDDVIRRIAELGSLRYTFENGVLRVERDTVYMKNYIVDFLNLIRSNTGSLTINTQVLGGASGGSGDGSSSNGLSSGSTNAVSTSYEGDMWASVEQGITDILNFSPSDLSAATISTDGVAATSTVDALAGFTLNRQAGVISVRATEKQHRNVAEYLKQVKINSSSQVLIEAKIVEVNLDKQYRSGVNWNAVNNRTDFAVDFAFNNPVAASTVPDVVTLTLGDSDLSTIVKFVEQFGTTRTISSPRLHAMNNQQAVLTFAENDVYFTIEVERQEDTDGAGVTDITSTVTSTLNTVPIGVILSLQPSIDLENQEVTMNIRPTLSRITSREDDPGVTLSAQQIDPDSTITSSVPVIEVREMDSILKIKSGEVMVIGGLMEERASNIDIGVPGLSRIPILGHAFKSVERTTDVVETVIFIKATIVTPNGFVGKADRDFYKTFTRSPRPLTF